VRRVFVCVCVCVCVCVVEKERERESLCACFTSLETSVCTLILTGWSFLKVRGLTPGR
jgi:hypothetical protein